MLRHAQLSQDKQWLDSKWTVLERTVKVIQRLRGQTKENPDALDYGLISGGYIDGGLDNKPPGSKPRVRTNWVLMVSINPTMRYLILSHLCSSNRRTAKLLRINFYGRLTGAV